MFLSIPLIVEVGDSVLVIKFDDDKALYGLLGPDSTQGVFLFLLVHDTVRVVRGREDFLR